MERSLRRDPSPTPSAFTPSRRLAPFRGQQFWVLPVVCGVLAGGATLLLTRLHGAAVASVSPALQLFAAGLAAAGALVVSHRQPKSLVRWAWRCLCLAFVSASLAAAFTLGSVITQISRPAPTPKDLFSIFFYPLLVAGLLLLPSTTLTPSGRVRVLLDALLFTFIVLGGALLIFSVPLFGGSQLAIPDPFVTLTAPVKDVLILSALFLLRVRGVEPTLRPTLIWLVAGSLVFVYADSAHVWFLLHHTYAPGMLLVDPFWILGELLFTLAPLSYLIHGDMPGEAWQWIVGDTTLSRRGLVLQRYGKYLFSYLPALVILPFVRADDLFNTPADAAVFLDGLAVVIVLLIITRQLVTQRSLMDAQVAQRRTQQLDALKDQFITNVNHELRTPLMTMQTYVELIRQRQQELPERPARIIEEIGHTSDNLVELVQSILEVRRLDQETRDFPHETVNVQQVFSHAQALVNPHEGRMAERDLRVQIPPDLAIWGEPVRIQQILTNLLSNAIKYSSPGSAIEVSAARSLARPPKKIKRHKGGPMVEIQVRDYGLGIPPDEIPLLFHRFVRLERDLASEVVGSGIGLYLCQTLVEAMDGAIWVESTGIAGQGSTFHVLLPYAPVNGSMPQAEAHLTIDMTA